MLRRQLETMQLEVDQKAVFGRGNGFSTSDPTVSRRHVLLETEHKTEPTTAFEVLGRNPIWVRSHEDGAVRVFRRSEKGELANGDWLCVSGKRPVWYRVRYVEGGKRVLESESEMAEVLGNGSESEDFDVSGIDPVKEFGFLVMGHEFDQYPKRMIRDVKNWNWFLEEPRKESDNYDESERKERRGRRSKRKKGEENEDDDWTGESEADEEIVAKLRKVSKPKYSTRLKASSKPQKDTKVGTSSVQSETAAADEEDMEDDDETLGGFIVGEDDLEEEDLEETDEYEEEEEEEEEEFVEDD